ncbi:MAG: HPF/RaiA family ribosome-associated protein [Kofleriaceae bacterium]
MNPTISVLFHGMDRSEAVEAEVARWVARLDHIYDRIQSCRVTIDRPHQHHHDARFQVRIELGLPGEDITVSQHGAHADAYVALSDAFTTARRQLHDRIQIQRGA